MKAIAIHHLLVLAVVAPACGTSSDSSAAESAPAGEKGGHEEHGEGVIELTAEQLAAARIQVAKVEKRSQVGLLQTSAQLEAAADRQARVGPRVAGRVSSLSAALGATVKKGALLAVIDSPDLGRAKADFLAAAAGAKVTRESADREKALYDKRISSERDWREAEAAAVKARAEKEAAENRLHALGVGDASLPSRVEGHYSSRISLTSPIDGVVVERSATLGQMVEPSDTLFTVMDLREVWVLMDVYERDLTQVRVGQKVQATVAAYPDRTYAGVVDNIGAVVEPKTRAVKVRIVLPNPDGTLKPGMFATVTVEGTSGVARQYLVVPDKAIQRDGERTIVFIQRAERVFAPREVEVEHTSGGQAAIGKGLSEGEAVVTEGSFVLKSELKRDELGGEE